MLTPIEKHGDIFLKRDDLFEVAGVQGGKVRTCLELSKTRPILVTAGSRSSPQVNIVAHIAKMQGKRCRVHTPLGKLSPEVEMAVEMGAELVQHKAGYNSVIVKRANDDAISLGTTAIPFGMECKKAIDLTSEQIGEIPSEVQRIVVPIGSGMSFCGILLGLEKAGYKIPVLGVRVGSDPTKRFKTWLPRYSFEVKTVVSRFDYHKEIKSEIGGVVLDPIYEAKCEIYLKPFDMLWCVGIRKTV